MSASTGGARALSKATIDVALCQIEQPDHFTHEQFSNTVPGFKKLLSWLKKQGADASNSFVGMEHTGHYTLALSCFLQEGGMAYTLISPLHLKRSLGMARGKNDRVDAGRIAWFICLHQRVLTPTQLPSGCILKLKNPGGEPLMAFRDRLVKTSTSLKNTLTDLRETSQLIDNSLIIKLSHKQQKLVEQQIAHIEKEMEATVKQDEQVLKHFQLVKSVVGVGLITAAAFLVYTQDFTAFDRTGAPERPTVRLLRRSGSLRTQFGQQHQGEGESQFLGQQENEGPSEQLCSGGRATRPATESVLP